MLDKKNIGDIKRMVDRAKLHVKEQYSAKRLISDIEKLYFELYNSKGRAPNLSARVDAPAANH